MSDRNEIIESFENPPAPEQSEEPQELPGAEPSLDRDDDDPEDGPIGNAPGKPKVSDADDP
jgi:hypothetical protein